MLALKVEYLTGVYMATRYDDPSRSTPEWPPHPDRLYSALVAAAATLPDADEMCLPERAVLALKWLAAENWSDGRVVAPELHVPDAHHRWAMEVYMPTNPHEDEVWQKPKKGKQRVSKKGFDLKTLLPIYRKKAALPMPAVIPDEPFAYFVWPDAHANGHIETLREICERVTYLGRSRSLVRVSIVDEPPASTHVPDFLGQVALRVPGPDRLEHLGDAYTRRGGKPDPCPPQRYRRICEQSQSQNVARSIFERMYIFKPQSGDPALPMTSTLKVTQALRKALIACIGENGGQVPDVVHGHGMHPHCAYIALPFVHPRQRHADGSIKGLAVLVPRAVEEQNLLPLAGGLMRLQENGLRIPGIGVWHLVEVSEDNPLVSLNARTWQGPSRLWTTVTPMVFGHFPKPGKGGAAKVVLDSLDKVGIAPDVATEIAISQHAPLYGASPSWYYMAKGNQRDSNGPLRVLYHVSLRFDRPIAGPIILGSKRYFGLGLMWPMEDR